MAVLNGYATSEAGYLSDYPEICVRFGGHIAVLWR